MKRVVLLRLVHLCYFDLSAYTPRVFETGHFDTCILYGKGFFKFIVFQFLRAFKFNKRTEIRDAWRFRQYKTSLRRGVVRFD